MSKTKTTEHKWRPMGTEPRDLVIVRGSDGIERRYANGMVLMDGLGIQPVAMPKEWRYMVEEVDL